MAEEKKKKATKETALEIYVGQDKMSLAKSVSDQVKMLSMPTPTKYIMQRKGRGNLLLDYVETNYVMGLLNAIFKFDWDSEIIEQIVDKDEGQIAMKVRITVRFADGKVVTKTAWGGSDIKRMKEPKKMVDFADDLKSAESDGIKKAASMLGICWDVYSGLTTSGKKKQTKSKATYGLTQEPSGPPDRKNDFRTIAIKVGSKTVLHTKYEALDRFKEAKEKLGKELYYKILGEHGYEKSNLIPPDEIPKLYYAMVESYEASKLKPVKATTEDPTAGDVKIPGLEETIPSSIAIEKEEGKVTTEIAVEAIKKVNQSTGFSTEELENEAEVEEMPSQDEIMELTRLEVKLVDSYEYAPDAILETLKKLFGKSDGAKLTRKQTKEAIAYFKGVMVAKDAAKEQ